jgi:RNA ligase
LKGLIMQYKFPIIKHINDVLPHIEGSKEFIVVEKDGYTVINYVLIGNDTFPAVTSYADAVRRECRGLIFDPFGNLINRRYHKFFNFGEREECMSGHVNFDEPHRILEKLDGSMVSPCKIGIRTMWFTKMGITDTGAQACEFVRTRPVYYKIADECLDAGMTPIFEWCSNKNRIVLDYPDDALILTAIRNNETGVYSTIDALQLLAKQYDIPVVQVYEYSAKDDIRDVVKAWEGSEGIVIRFNDGHMLKVKSDWYIKIHRVKALLGRARDVVNLILSNQIDDMLPVLPEKDQVKIRDFSNRLLQKIAIRAFDLHHYISDMKKKHLTKKSYALSQDSDREGNRVYQSFVFRYYDVDTPNTSEFFKIISDYILVHTTSNGTFAKAKDAFLFDCDYANESQED